MQCIVLTVMILTITRDGRRQIVFYQSGVGSEADFAGNALPEDTLIGTRVFNVFVCLAAVADIVYSGSWDGSW